MLPCWVHADSGPALPAYWVLHAPPHPSHQIAHLPFEDLQSSGGQGREGRQAATLVGHLNKQHFSLS